MSSHVRRVHIAALPRDRKYLAAFAAFWGLAGVVLGVAIVTVSLTG